MIENRLKLIEDQIDSLQESMITSLLAITQLQTKYEEIVDHINDKLPPLQHSAGIMQCILEDLEKEVYSITKSMV